MSLYACSQCNAVDNTALSNFHQQAHRKEPVLCSSCDPAINTWHDQFPRRTYQDAGYQFCPDYLDTNRRILCPKDQGYDYCHHRRKQQ